MQAKFALNLIPLEISFLSPTDPLWQKSIAANTEANIFHHPAWIDTLAQCYGFRPFIASLLDKDGKIAAGLPVMEVHQPFSKMRWVSLPFTDHCAPLNDDIASLNVLLDGISQATKYGVSEIELRWNYAPFPGLQSQPCFVFHKIALDPTRCQTSSPIHPMHARNARLAQKKGVQIRFGTDRRDMEVFYQLHLQTRRRQGVPIQPRRFFDLICSQVIDQGLGFILMALKDNTCLAAALFLHWQNTLTYKFGASSLDSLNLRPNDLIFWSAIQWGLEHGFTCLDLGRTDMNNTGLREFKSRWGAEEIPLYYSYIPYAPAQTIRANERLHDLLQAVIRHSPTSVCRTVGEIMYRFVG